MSSLTAASPNASLMFCRASLAPDLEQWRRRHPGETPASALIFGPGALRVRYSRGGGNEYCLATTLLDQNQFPLAPVGCVQGVVGLAGPTRVGH